MSFKVTVVLCCLTASTLGRPEDVPAARYGHPAPEDPLTYKAPSPYEETHEKGMPFAFEYGVKDDYKGLDYGHKSNSNGKVVTGEYRVVLPDGRTQIVTYTADYNGYHAEVKYEGEAKYPEPQPYKLEPVYAAPKPTYDAPEPTYEEPAPTYGTPAPTYDKPSPLSGAPEQ